MSLLDIYSDLEKEFQDKKWTPKFNGSEMYPSKSLTKMNNWTYDSLLKKEIFGWKRFFIFFTHPMWEVNMWYPKNEKQLEKSFQCCKIMCEILNKEDQEKIKLQKYYNDINT